MNRERYMQAKRHFSRAAGAAAGLEVVAERSGLGIVATREAVKLLDALRELERIVDESRKEAQLDEVVRHGT